MKLAYLIAFSWAGWRARGIAVFFLVAFPGTVGDSSAGTGPDKEAVELVGSGEASDLSVKWRSKNRWGPTKSP